MLCLKCPSKPALVLQCKESKIVFQALNQSKVFCKGCGYLFGKDYKRCRLYGCLKCLDYFICSNCKLCANGHFLFKCYSLRLKGPGSYSENTYKCDRCLKLVPLRKPGEFVWHCNTCKYDVCPSHFQERPHEEQTKNTGVQFEPMPLPPAPEMPANIQNQESSKPLPIGLFDQEEEQYKLMPSKLLSMEQLEESGWGDEEAPELEEGAWE